MVGLRDDPCGTLQMRLRVSKEKGARLTYWVLPVSKEQIQWRDGHWIPMLCRHQMRMEWETILNAAERSRRMRAAVSPLSRIMQMSSVATMRAVSLLWLRKYPDCYAKQLVVGEASVHEFL